MKIKVLSGVLTTFLILLLIGSSPVLALSSITAGDMEITSRLMTFENGIYVARGGLKATQKDTVLIADRGIYDRNLEIVKAIDNVEVTQPGSVLTSDYLEAFVKEDRILAKGKPKLVRIVERQGKNESGEMAKKKSRVILTCNEVEGFNKENRFVAKGNVHLIEVPYREGETEEEAEENEKAPVSDLVCEILEIYSTEDKAIARNNVVIVTKTLRATGDKAIYLDKENRLIIVGNAHAYQTSKEKPGDEDQVSELYAKKIIYYPNEDRTIAVGEVHATVYPKGQKGKDDTSEEGKKKKKKKKKGEGEEGVAEGDKEKGEGKEETAVIESDSEKSGEQPVEKPGGPPAGLPAGDYTPIGEEGAIEAKSE